MFSVCGASLDSVGPGGSAAALRRLGLVIVVAEVLRLSKAYLPAALGSTDRCTLSPTSLAITAGKNDVAPTKVEAPAYQLVCRTRSSTRTNIFFSRQEAFALQASRYF